MPKPVSRVSAARSIDQDIGRLHVLVNESSFVQSAKCVPETNGDSQKRLEFPSFRREPFKGLATRPFEHDASLSEVLRDCDGTGGPKWIKIIPKGIFMLQLLR